LRVNFGVNFDQVKIDKNNNEPLGSKFGGPNNGFMQRNDKKIHFADQKLKYKFDPHSVGRAL